MAVEDMMGFPAAAPTVIASIDDPPAPANVMDDEFNGPRLDARWSWLNQGAATATLSNGSLILEAPASASRNIRAILQTVPAGDFTVMARMRNHTADLTTSQHVGLIVKNSGGNQILVFCFCFDADSKIYVQRDTSVTAFSATLGGAGVVCREGRIYQKITRVGTLLTFWFSYTGIDWWSYVTETETTFLPGAVNQVGLFADSISNKIVRNVCEWFRVTRP